MSREETIEVLLEVAKIAAANTTAVHPEDIQIAMSTAMEYSAITLQVLQTRKEPS